MGYFKCQICDEFQPNTEINFHNNPIFPVCDNCKSDLKNYVTDIRAERSAREPILTNKIPN